MPRQDIIYFTSAVPSTAAAVGAVVAAADEVRGFDLAWSRPGQYGDGTPGHVQVGLTLSPDELTRLATVRQDEPLPFSRTLYTDDLTREQINLLIRTLRRARDAAYGSDE